MKTLHRYLTRQILAALAMSTAIFTAVLLLGSIFKELLLLLVHREISLGVIAEAVGMLIPYVWTFALPMGLLTATLLVFGRFSADGELTAARSGGVSLISLTTPILALSLLLCGVCAFINMELAPRCWNGYKNLVSRANVQIRDVKFPEGRYIRDFADEGYVFYIGRNRKGQLQDVTVLISETNLSTTVRAPTGRIIYDTTNRQITVELYNAKSVMLYSDRVGVLASPTYSLDLKLPEIKVRSSRGLTEMTFWELQKEIRDLDSRMKLPASLQNRTDAETVGKRAILEKQMKDITSPARVQMHQQVSFSFACFGFTLVGIPLAIRVQRRETNIGFFIALALVAVYYGFMLLGKGLATNPELAPHLIMWLPNFIFQVAGAVLLWRANRGI